MNKRGGDIDGRRDRRQDDYSVGALQARVTPARRQTNDTSCLLLFHFGDDETMRSEKVVNHNNNTFGKNTIITLAYLHTHTYGLLSVFGWCTWHMYNTDEKKNVRDRNTNCLVDAVRVERVERSRRVSNERIVFK